MQVIKSILTANSWCTGYQMMWNPFSLFQKGTGEFRLLRNSANTKHTLAVLKYD